ncbi:MAG: VanZ family protein [Geminicoccaceae bacterium]
MSDIIETGSKRSVPDAKQPNAEQIGKKRKIAKSEDELELGRFVGDSRRKSAPDKAKPEDPVLKSEVVGPKRRRADVTSPMPKPNKDGAELLQIAEPLVVEDEPTTKRPRAKRRSRPIDADKGQDWGRLGVFALLSILLVALTAATFLLLPRHDVVGDPLIAEPGFEPGLTDWQRAGLVTQDSDDPGRVVLESIDPGARTHLIRDIVLPPGKTMMILRAQVQGHDVVPGPKPWDTARIYLVQIDANGEPDWSDDHNLFTLSGTTDVRNYRRVFSIPDGVEKARLAIEMKKATGRFTVNGLELTVVEYRMTFLIAVGFLLAAWSILVLYIGSKTFSGIESKRIKHALGVVCALSLIALMLPGGLHRAGAVSLSAWLGIGEIGIDAIGHAIMFTVLALLVRLGRPSDPLWLHVGVWLLIAIASEFLQLFTIGRDPSLDDLWVDGFGILLGLTLAEIMGRMQRSLKT